jgi:hypothetical protein
MAEGQIRFDDGAAYERMMGVWSRLAGAIFLEWLAPPAAVDRRGCGSGALSDLIVERAAPWCRGSTRHRRSWPLRARVQPHGRSVRAGRCDGPSIP